MTKRKIIALGLVVVGLSLAAGSAFALGSLVPCGLKDNPATEEVNEATPPCQTCDLLVLGKNISDFILFYLVPALAALAFTWAGFLILLGGGVPSQIAQGQNIFRTTVYGLLIIFLAWLIVNTILRTVAGERNIAENWWKLECQEPTTPENDTEEEGEGEVLTISHADVDRASITGTSAKITWETNKPATSQVDRGGGTLTTLDSNRVEAHAVTLTGLNPGTEYRVTAISVDDTNYRAESGVIIFKTSSGSVGSQFRFVTDEKLPDAVLSQNYSLQIAMDGGKPPYKLKLKSGSKLPEGLTMTAGGLISGKPTKLYESGDGLFFVIEAEDSSNPPTPVQKSFWIKVVATASSVVISNVAHNNITTTGVTITWKTDKPATSQVKYGTTSTLGTQSALDSTQTTNHTVTLSGLNPNTNYNYRVYSRVTGGEAESSNYPFKTQDTATAPLGIITGSLSDGAVNQNYNQTVQASGGKTPYTWSKSGNFPAGLSLNSSTGAITGKPTTAGDYAFTMRVQDATTPSALSSSRNFTIKIGSSAEVVTISGVASSNITATGATITWKTDKGASSQVEYTNSTTGAKQSSATQSGSRTSHSVPLSGLTPNTNYSVQAISVGATGYRAVSSPPISFKTGTTAPTPTPLVISEVASSNITANSAKVTWKTDKPSTSQVEYGTSTSYGSTTTINNSLVADHSVTVSGLSADRTYNYRVISSVTSPTTYTARSSNNTFRTQTSSGGTLACMYNGVNYSTFNLCSEQKRSGGCGTPTKCSQYLPAIQQYANGAATVDVLKTFMVIESDCNVKAGTSSSYGLMQLRPSTANMFKARCGVTDNIDSAWLTNPVNAAKSICIGAAFINSLAAGTCGAQPRNIYAGYNAGPGNCAASSDCKNDKSCDGGTMKRWECPYDNPEHTVCNTGMYETKQGATYINYCMNNLGY